MLVKNEGKGGSTYTNTGPDSSEHGDLEAITDSVEVVLLGLPISLVVPLSGDARVDLVVDVGLLEWLRHDV